MNLNDLLVLTMEKNGEKQEDIVHISNKDPLNFTCEEFGEKFMDELIVETNDEKWRSAWHDGVLVYTAENIYILSEDYTFSFCEIDRQYQYFEIVPRNPPKLEGERNESR